MAATVGTVAIAGLTNVAGGKLGLNLTITGKYGRWWWKA